MTNPPSVPSLDVEACAAELLRLAQLLKDFGHGFGSGLMSQDSNADAAFLEVVASALPGMGKDSELLDTLERFGWVKAGWGLVTQFDWTRKADDGPGGWARLISPRLRDAIDARSRGPQARTKL